MFGEKRLQGLGCTTGSKAMSGRKEYNI